ncbi:MAG: hypothetical protein IKZ41_11485, partial [Clostridia bacterium]|nr:hypothetical protein [Clostridia bacterium]
MPEKNAKKPRIPRHLPVCFAWVFGLQLLVYYGTRLLPSPAPHDLSTAWDRAIPLIPAWVAVYFLAYITWAAGFWRILTAERVRQRGLSCQGLKVHITDSAQIGR